MSNQGATNTDQATFWNEEGGQRWVENLDHVESMLEGVSAHLIAAVAAQPDERVLDIGCGGGPTSAALARAVGAGGRVLGVDISAIILEQARARFGSLPQLEFKLADAATHAFEPEAFDVITSRFGVMFFDDPAAAFTNLRQAARPTARLAFLCWRGLEENPWMGAPARAAFTVVPAPEKPAPGTPGPFAFADPDRLTGILTSAGFADVQLEPLEPPINLGPVEQAVAWLTRMGPAAAPLAEASAADRERAQAAMREVLAAHAGDSGVEMPGAVWLVRARAS